MSHTTVADSPPTAETTPARDTGSAPISQENDRGTYITFLPRTWTTSIDAVSDLSTPTRFACAPNFRTTDPPFLLTSRELVTATTAFWNSYMKLGEEYDKEVRPASSQPSARHSSSKYNRFTRAVPPDIKIVVAQSLLYISLFTALLASLLAVLGSQWLMYYHALVVEELVL
ncbi:hypothetical protein B0H14DRAFT_3141326 [Mycena olivaceomarginata]|nr:hypothetical protein B0H14DRAFT_3141326 [Mycena olivaceomarginata]